MKKEERIEIRASCLRLLSRREHSQSELLRKVVAKGKGYDVADIQAVIDELAEENWQCDQRFAENYIRQRIQKGYGPVRINFELKQRGIELSCADLDVDDQPDWIVVLESVYAKKYSTDQKQVSKSEWSKRSRFLQQRGFTGAMIKALFGHLSLTFDFSA